MYFVLIIHKTLYSGDDGKIEIESNGLIKETENTYTLWCSGRTCCEGMLVELKFIKVIKFIGSYTFLLLYPHIKKKKN